MPKKVKFIGDPKDDFSGPSNMVWQGHTFPKGKYREVPDAVAKKASGHSHFVVEGEEDPTEEPAVEKDWTLLELQAILNDRGVKYGKRDGADKLMDLVVNNGGLPE